MTIFVGKTKKKQRVCYGYQYVRPRCASHRVSDGRRLLLKRQKHGQDGIPVAREKGLAHRRWPRQGELEGIRAVSGEEVLIHGAEFGVVLMYLAHDWRDRTGMLRGLSYLALELSHRVFFMRFGQSLETDLYRCCRYISYSSIILHIIRTAVIPVRL